MKHTILDATANELIAAAKEVQQAHGRLFDLVARECGENSPEAEELNAKFSEYQRKAGELVGVSVLLACEFPDGVTAEG